MKIISDLHIHSRFSRATSIKLDLLNLEKWARVKGVNLLGTGDFTHPKWIAELKNNLKEEDGILKSKTGFNFLLQTEISNIYTQDGRGRRVHNIILAPNFEIVDQINEALGKKGRLDYDGRPIFGFSCVELVDIMNSISKDIEIIPAHCLLPNEPIQCNPKLKTIGSIKEGDKVLTHKGRFKRVNKVYKRFYKGNIYKVTPRYFSQGLITTNEHPFYAIKTLKNCSWTNGICKPTKPHINYCVTKAYSNYKPRWIPVKYLSKGDVILYPRLKETKDKKVLKVNNLNIKIEPNFCRLIGYYLAEGYTNGRDGFGFSFNKNEKQFIDDVKKLVKKYFGLDVRKGKSNGELIFYSKKIMQFFINNFYNGIENKAYTKILPNWFLYLPKNKQIELFKGWWYGDKGYTSSKELLNQMKLICLRLGIIPSIRVDKKEDHKNRGKHFIIKREIKANYDNYAMDKLTFFEDNFGLINNKHFKSFIKRDKFRYGWIDENYVYLPIRKIEISDYSGLVYNLEVNKDNSYSSEFACVHNCWTPWFSIFGSMSGFNSVEECFLDRAKYIHALETGLSSDPAMNWRISRLDDYALVSFSDLHSFWPWRLGREATIFDINLNYKNLINAIRTRNGLKETIEVDPAYGKYHYDGHRMCNVCLSPDESLKNKDICPKCGRKLTIGVAHRVEELADRDVNYKSKNAIPFKTIIPLSELLSVYYNKEISTKFIWNVYNKIIEKYSEFDVLLNLNYEQLKEIMDSKLISVMLQNREGKIKVKPGCDGVYGVPILEVSYDKKQKSLMDF